MFKHISRALAFVALVLVFSIPAHATATPVQQGGVTVNGYPSGGGVCTAVTTGAVITSLVAANTRRTSLTLYATTQMNIEPGDTAGNAPTIAPTTGAIGTGVGFPIPATTMVTIQAGAIQAPQFSGVALNLPPGDRIDAIAASSNGYVCAWEQF